MTAHSGETDRRAAQRGQCTAAAMTAPLLLAVSGAIIVLAAASSADAQTATGQVDAAIEEVVVIGSRRPGRSAAESTAPIDVIAGVDFSQAGNTGDITDNLRFHVPSFNAAIASGDGDTFVRPTSLRGLAPDQTLVMVNGKRRHRAALIAEFVPAAGKGAHGPQYRPDSEHRAGARRGSARRRLGAIRGRRNRRRHQLRHPERGRGR